MSTRRKPRLVDAPMALASDGTPLLNITHLVDAPDPVAAIRGLLAAGHTLFVGVVVPARDRKRFAGEVEDALADVVGRTGTRLTSKASARSWEAQASAHRGRAGSRARRPRGRRP